MRRHLDQLRARHPTVVPEVTQEDSVPTAEENAEPTQGEPEDTDSSSTNFPPSSQPKRNVNPPSRYEDNWK